VHAALLVSIFALPCRRYIQRGLFERHKLLFALMLTNKVLVSAGKVGDSPGRPGGNHMRCTMPAANHITLPTKNLTDCFQETSSMTETRYDPRNCPEHVCPDKHFSGYTR
jgi:hypothetical protein